MVCKCEFENLNWLDVVSFDTQMDFIYSVRNIQKQWNIFEHNGLEATFMSSRSNSVDFSKLYFFSPRISLSFSLSSLVLHTYITLSSTTDQEKNCPFNISEMRIDSCCICLHFKQNAFYPNALVASHHQLCQLAKCVWFFLFFNWSILYYNMPVNIFYCFYNLNGCFRNIFSSLASFFGCCWTIRRV